MGVSFLPSFSIVPSQQSCSIVDMNTKESLEGPARWGTKDELGQD